MIKVGEISCKTALNRSGIEGVDYAINPYIGCSHGCVYCYARFMTRWYHKGEEWGSFVSVKKNIEKILKTELLKKRKGIVLLSSVTDPYQPIENETQLTRSILKNLSEHDFPVEILTKSSLVIRDKDILSVIDRCEVGLTITMWDDNARKVFEPNTSSISQRLRALKVLHDEGISTFAFLGPLLPIISENGIEFLLKSLVDRVDRVLVDRLNIKSGNWKKIKYTLQENYPEILDNFQLASSKESMYYSRLKGKMRNLIEERMIPVEILY